MNVRCNIWSEVSVVLDSACVLIYSCGAADSAARRRSRFVSKMTEERNAPAAGGGTTKSELKTSQIQLTGLWLAYTDVVLCHCLKNVKSRRVHLKKTRRNRLRNTPVSLVCPSLGLRLFTLNFVYSNISI